MELIWLLIPLLFLLLTAYWIYLYWRIDQAGKFTKDIFAYIRSLDINDQLSALDWFALPGWYDLTCPMRPSKRAFVPLEDFLPPGPITDAFLIWRSNRRSNG